MQINKLNSNASNNIRIRKNSRSKSKEVPPSDSKVGSKIVSPNIQNLTSSKTQLQSRKLGRFQKLDSNLFAQKTNKYLEIKQRRILTLSNKENKASTNKKTNQNFQTGSKNSSNEPLNLTKYSIICHLLKKDSHQSENNQQTVTKMGNMDFKARQSIQIQNNKQGCKIEEEIKQQNFIQVFRTQSNLFTTNIKQQWFQIDPQFSLNFSFTKSKHDTQTQTHNSSVQDKYFLQYTKLRQLKIQSFNQIQSQQEKIKHILSSTLDFNQNYDDLISSINQGPNNDREKRIYALGKDLAQHQLKFNQAFQKVDNIANKFEEYIEKNFQQINQKKTTLFISIENLIKAQIIQTKKQRPASRQHKLQIILARVLNQLKSLSQFVLGQGIQEYKTMNIYKNQILSIKKRYDQFSRLFLQNRVLLNIMIKQIQKIPALMITLFGYDVEEVKSQQSAKQECLEQGFGQYMKMKCLECYHTKKKIKFLQFQNKKIKPVFKSLQWLIRDSTKNQCCLSLI